jgi:hypothetical protein
MLSTTGDDGSRRQYRAIFELKKLLIRDYLGEPMCVVGVCCSRDVSCAAADIPHSFELVIMEESPVAPASGGSLSSSTSSNSSGSARGVLGETNFHSLVIVCASKSDKSALVR